MVLVGLDMVHECKRMKCQFQEMKEGSSWKIFALGWKAFTAFWKMGRWRWANCEASAAASTRLYVTTAEWT
jgi:hypothetical protein